LSAVRADLDADLQTRRAVREALTGPISSAVLLAGLPVVGVALGAAMGARPGEVLLHSPIGVASLCTGVVLELLGIGWTLAMARRATP
jgi:tight adherence protein B